MANDSLYEVFVTYKDSSLKHFVFRKSLPLEQAVQLASSLWMSTDNDSLMVTVRETDKDFSLVTFYHRSE